MQKQSTKETIEFLDFAFGLADATKQSLASDGKINLFDVPNYVAVAFKAPAAFGGIELVPKELGQLKEEGRTEVLAYFENRFDLPNDELEALIERTLVTGWEFGESLRAIITYKKEKVG
jgi:hypothetical protein